MDRGTFASLVRDALAHLRNRFYLGRHPLAAMFAAQGRPLTGDALRGLLLAEIGALKPMGSATGDDADWRRCQLLILRFDEGQSLEQVARGLGISVRQATRDQRQAVESLTEILWTRLHSAAEPIETPQLDESVTEAEGTQPADLADEIAKVAARREIPTDLAETVDGALATLRSLAEERSVTLRSLVADALPPIALSRTLLRQAILNMLIHTIEAYPGREVLLAGTDTVRGVALRVLVQTFTEGASRPAGDSSVLTEGQELVAAARQLVETQAGTLECGSVELGQPLFTVVLPPVEVHTVLVVDDNPDLVGLFRRYLRAQPYRVIQATSGPAALQLGAKLRPVMILLDVMMPSQDGWEVLQLLRGHPETRDIPIVVCSVLPEMALARSLGVTGFLPKPVTRQALLEVLAHSHRAEV